jgi:hypothetical protein
MPFVYIQIGIEFILYKKIYVIVQGNSKFNI